MDAPAIAFFVEVVLQGEMYACGTHAASLMHPAAGQKSIAGAQHQLMRAALALSCVICDTHMYACCTLSLHSVVQCQGRHNACQCTRSRELSGYRAACNGCWPQYLGGVVVSIPCGHSIACARYVGWLRLRWVQHAWLCGFVVSGCTSRQAGSL